MKQLLNKEIFKEKEIHVIDCRFNYEYQGGHIKNALNVTDPAILEEKFFKNLISSKTEFDERNEMSIIVFHCEFSQKRGPKM